MRVRPASLSRASFLEIVGQMNYVADSYRTVTDLNRSGQGSAFEVTPQSTLAVQG